MSLVNSLSPMWVVFVIIWLHFIADFILQSDNIAKNKSKSNVALSIHMIIYGLPLFLIGPLYASINAILHGITDYVTSRVTSYYWSKGETHNFFVVIGLDQANHLTCLIGTYYLMNHYFGAIF